MARLFIRHEPVECKVDPSVDGESFYVHRDVLNKYGLQIDGPNNMSVAYVCFVSDGKCWAARSFRRMGNKEIRVACVPFNDDPSGQKMILADMILN